MGHLPIQLAPAQAVKGRIPKPHVFVGILSGVVQRQGRPTLPPDSPFTFKIDQAFLPPARVLPAEAPLRRTACALPRFLPILFPGCLEFCQSFSFILPDGKGKAAVFSQSKSQLPSDCPCHCWLLPGRPALISCADGNLPGCWELSYEAVAFQRRKKRTVHHPESLR